MNDIQKLRKANLEIMNELFKCNVAFGSKPKKGKPMSKSLPPGPKKGETIKEHEKKTGIENAKKTMPKEYKEGGADTKKEYADPKNNKYPIDTPEHVRAALAYFNKPKNYGMYSPAERKSMMSRINGAARKHGISVSDKSAPGTKK